MGFPAARGQETKAEISALAESFQRSAGQRLRSLEAEFGQREAHITESFSELDQKVEALRGDLGTRESEIQQRFEDLQATLTTTRQSVDQLVAEEGDRFRAEQTQRDEEFKRLRDETETTMKTLREEQEESNRQHGEALARHLKQSEELVGKISVNTTAGHFLKEANREWWQAIVWSGLTFLLGLGAITATIFAAVGENPSVAHVLAKLGVATATGALAGFSGKQAANHRKREQDLRDLQLQLSAFEPIIQRLDGKAGERETVVLVRKLFGQPYGQGASEDGLPSELRIDANGAARDVAPE